MQTSPSTEQENIYEINFLQVCLEMLQTLQRWEVCKKLDLFEVFKAYQDDVPKMYRFQNEMRCKFASCRVVMEQGLSNNLKKEFGM